MSKHYVISDIHGMYNIYEQVCAMLKPNDIVFFLGDAGDRGYDGFRCIKEIYENPQWVYLKGNHEDLMAKGLMHIHKSTYHSGHDFSLWMYNGGKNTYEGWCKDGVDSSWIAKLNNLELIAEYTNSKGIKFHMSHAGYTCGNLENLSEEDLLWNRLHFYDKWDEEKFPNDICIHGHTPRPYLIKDLRLIDHKKSYTNIPTAEEYANGHKICIDNGVFYTGFTVLYDLDEMKAIPLFDKHFAKEDDNAKE